MFKKLNQKNVYQNKWMTVFEDDVEFPNGSVGIYGYVKRTNGAGALVINPQNEVLLIQQYRYPIKAWEWNIPGGGVDDKEEPKVATEREIQEETGLRVKSIEKIGQFYPLSSCSTELVSLFLVKVDNEKLEVKQRLEDESISEMKFVSITEALRMVDDGEITDATTCNAIQILARKINTGS
jgi:ADP-ribose pyrophosphatase